MTELARARARVVMTVAAIALLAGTASAWSSSGAQHALRLPSVRFGQRMSSVVNARQLAGLGRPVHLGDERGLHVQPVCPNGACGALRLVNADGSANVTEDVADPFWLTPSELHLFYQLPVDSVSSPAPTIAVIEEGPDLTAESDLSYFSNYFGIANCTTSCFSEYYGTFTPSNYSAESLPTQSGMNTAGETTLDLDAVHSTCENCSIMLVQVDISAATPGDEVVADMAAATAWAAHHGGPSDTGASVISFSYSPTSLVLHYPQPTGTYSASYADFAQPGHVIVASSGDLGFGQAVTPYLSGFPFPAYPASNPNVIAAGGTTLSANTDGTYAGESVWNDSSGAGGSGCGYIDNPYYGLTWSYAAPSWQTSDPHHAAEGCSYRALADVSADADPTTGLQTYQTYNPNSSAWQVSGGTSLSAPLIAGMYALAGGYPSAPPTGGCPNTATFDNCAASSLYANQADSVQALHDITAGNNIYVSGDTCGATTLCAAGTGLDGPTGVGTPIGLAAFGGPSHPNATTQSATSVTSSSATLNALVDPVGSAGTIAYFCYGLGDPYSNCANNASIGTSAQSVSQSLTGLSASTTYHYRIYASGPGGLGIGADGTFTTSPPPPPPTVIPPTASIGAWRSSGGSASASVSCSGASSTSCVVIVYATVHETLKNGKVVAVSAAARRSSGETRRRMVLVGGARVVVGGGQSETFTLRLNSVGTGLLKKLHTLPALLVTTSAATTLSTQTVIFKHVAKHPARHRR